MFEPIDCHALIVSDDRDRFPFDPDAEPPRPGEVEASLSPERLGAALADAVVAGAVLVQRGRFHGFDNRLVTAIAAKDVRLRALCTVDRAETHGAEARRLLASRHVAGIRLMEPHKGADLGWLESRALWSAAADAGALIDVHLFPWNRPAAIAALRLLIRDHPETPVLVDNLGAAAVEDGEPDFGIDAPLAALAEFANVTFKFSDMTIGRLVGAQGDAAAAIERFVRFAGADRLCWGSDVLPAGRSYGEAVSDAQAAVQRLAPDEQAAVLYGTARRLFALDA
ncbi:MAG: hypothetical protein JWM75_525 [Sphingomonas bacterium]|nr:hypothetical protein [Sphingomonas bacterium]